LLAIEDLHRRRAPGNTWLPAPREGTCSENGIVNNNSKGCGGVREPKAGLNAIHQCIRRDASCEAIDYSELSINSPLLSNQHDKKQQHTVSFGRL